jgi:hypothetical protein
MMMSESKLDVLTKKIIKMYKNYGLDVSNMSDEEISRIREKYEKMGSNIDNDLKKSEKYSGNFSDHIL